MNLEEIPPSRLIVHRPFPELAVALRAQAENIISAWTAAVRVIVPVTTHLPEVELRDNLPAILARMADVLESADIRHVEELMRESPAQGLARFGQRYDVRDLMTEDRLLRRVIIEQVAIALRRHMVQAEHIALDMAVDTMLQEAVVAFITQQNDKLRAGAEAELKYLSFLSHDLTNNLGSVTLLLQVLRQRLATVTEFEKDVKTLDAAQQAILDTIGGMGRLLQSERLRKAGVQPERRAVVISQVISTIVHTLADKAADKGVKIAVDVSDEVRFNSDPELIGLVVQNLAGNAVKYSTAGTVRLQTICKQHECLVTVSDEGPGIAAEHLEHIFDAFNRGESHSQPGVGLGLTIASQAAKLLGGKLDVESKIGKGSTFTFTFPV